MLHHAQALLHSLTEPVELTVITPSRNATAVQLNHGCVVLQVLMLALWIMHGTALCQTTPTALKAIIRHESGTQ